MKLPVCDIERVRRISAFLRTEVGLLSAHVVLSTGASCSVYRDGKISLRRPVDEETQDLEAPHAGGKP